MTAVQTWTLVAPTAMNSAASRQVAMPPMPETGKPIFGSPQMALTMLSAMGFTAGPQ